MNLLTEFDNLRLVYVSNRAYWGLALYNGNILQKCRGVLELVKCGIAESNIAAIQSDLSATAGLTWQLLSDWENLTEREAQQVKLKECLAKLQLPKQLKTLALAQPITVEMFDLDAECEKILISSSFFHYLGAGIPRTANRKFMYRRVCATVDYIKALDLKNIQHVSEILNLIGRNESYDLKAIWNTKFFNERLN